MIDYHDYRDAIFASDLTAPQKILALAISYHYNWKKQGPAFPSNRTLARETSLAVSSIVKAKRVLIDRGFITSEQRFNNSSEYTCNIPEQLVCSQIESNNEYNNELNNEKDKDSNESFVSINNIHQEDVDTTFEVFKESTAPAAISQEQADWLMSW